MCAEYEIKNTEAQLRLTIDPHHGPVWIDNYTSEETICVFDKETVEELKKFMKIEESWIYKVTI